MLRKLAGTQECYQIKNSIMLDSTQGQRLTPLSQWTGGSRTTNTFSFWVKRGKMSGDNNPQSGGVIYSAIESNAGLSNPYTNFGFNAHTDTFFFNDASGGSLRSQKVTTAVYRDPSAWYHFVVTVDTTNSVAEDRVRIYCNGKRITSFSTSINIPINTNTSFNYWNGAATYNAIGANINSPTPTYNYHFDGFLAEFYSIEGLALGPEYFGRACPISGEWEPIRYSGPLGTYGFYMDFQNAANLGSMKLKGVGQGSNNFAANGGIVAANQYADTPTNNFAVLNSLWPLGSGTKTYSIGNTKTVSGNTNGDNCASASTIFVPPGMSAYAEFKLLASNYDSTVAVGINGALWFKSGTAPMGTYAINDVIGVAYNSNGSVDFYKNGVFVGSLSVVNDGNRYFYISGSGNASPVSWQSNFGQRPFAYTPPTGFKSLCTRNLPTPSIKRPSTFFKTLLYTGSGAVKSVADTAGVSFMQPDLVWIKSRTAATDHALYDSVRGATKDLASNLTAAETTQAQGLTSFDANGFSVGELAKLNTLNAAYVAWCWKKGVTPGFDVVKYAGDGAASRNIAHGLGVMPSMMLIKVASAPVQSWSNWIVYHKNVAASPQNGYLRLNTTDSFVTSPDAWNNTAPTSSAFTVRQAAGAGINGNGDQFIAYLFAEVPGFSKFGSYVGNGNADGPFVFCGFRPALVLCKRIDSAGSWIVLDSRREVDNPKDYALYQNLSDAETWLSNGGLDFTSNGFKVRSTDTGINASGSTYVYAAFAEMPTKYALAR